jgi:hypothetical protein
MICGRTVVILSMRVMTPSPKMMSVSKLKRCTKCVPLNVTDFQLEETMMLIAISNTATT